MRRKLKMVGKTFKPLLCLFALVLACGTVFAQGHLPIAHTTPSKDVTPARATRDGLKAIFSNLGPTATNDYNDTTGYYVLGPSNSVGLTEQAIAIPFTPAQNSTVEVLQVAVGSISGTNLIVVGLYADSAGAPGTLLADRESKNITAFGTCCSPVTVNITPTAVTAGTQYWIGVSTDDVHAPDFTGVFQASNAANTAGNEALEGWFTFSNNLPAAAALGTVP
jgi:hypothetical protein